MLAVKCVDCLDSMNRSRRMRYEVLGLHETMVLLERNEDRYTRCVRRWETHPVGTCLERDGIIARGDGRDGGRNDGAKLGT